MIFFFQAEDGIRDGHVTGVQTCALPISDVETALADGRAMDTWRAMITAQGGDVDAPLPEARHVEQVRAESDGVVTGLDAMAGGGAAWRLGAGRPGAGAAVQGAAGGAATRPTGTR